MKEVSRLKRPIPFDHFRSPHLNLYDHLRYQHQNYISCGSAALGMLLNKSPKDLDKICNNAHAGWFTTQVIQFLKSKNFTVIQLSKDQVLPEWNHKQFPITTDHVLLINSRVVKKENSMFVVHDNIAWHNYVPTEMNGLFFINKPTQDVLLIHHPKWS